jgi:hypothetical protein
MGLILNELEWIGIERCLGMGNLHKIPHWDGVFPSLLVLHEMRWRYLGIRLDK